MTNETGRDAAAVERFTEALREAVAEAYRNGVDVEGGWLVRSSARDVPDWDIEIWRVEHAEDVPEDDA
jgi:hypothetical protein